MSERHLAGRDVHKCAHRPHMFFDRTTDFGSNGCDPAIATDGAAPFRTQTSRRPILGAVMAMAAGIVLVVAVWLLGSAAVAVSGWIGGML